jgi:HAD superfamily hydrolase (TIGR01490 family)
VTIRAAFFDLDKTVIARASMVAFGRTFYGEGLVTRTIMLRALWGQLVYMHLGASEEKLARMRESVLALTRGWHREHVRSVVRETLEDVVEPIIYAEALELIERHRKEGDALFLVSASPVEIVEPLAEFLAVDDVIATEAKIDEEGRYTGELSFYAYGLNKAEAMERVAAARGIDMGASFAYSDSLTDLPMLEVVGHPVVVNPDRGLARVARDRGWEVRSFVEPVRLRDRMPVGPAVSAGAAVAASAAGGAVWLWLRRREEPPPPSRFSRLRYSTRSLRAAMTPRPMRMARRKSFFIPPRLRPLANLRQ